MCVYYNNLHNTVTAMFLCYISDGEGMYDIHWITITVFIDIPEINNEMLPHNHRVS